jgi:acyl-CoA reductase-like NAD-dependent aldehyde dehydrogenase
MDVIRALQGANQAQTKLTKDAALFGTAAQREKILSALAQEISSHQDEIASALARTEAVPVRTFREVIGPQTVALLSDAAQLARVPSQERYQSAGVAVFFPPTYGAFFELGLRFAAAVTTGTSLIIMAPVDAPASAQLWFQLWDRVSRRTGHPAGLFQLLHGTIDELGSALMSHPALRVISAVGRPQMIKSLIEASAELRKSIHWSTGSRNPAVWVASPRWQENGTLERLARQAVLLSFDLHRSPAVRPTRYFIQESMASELNSALCKAIEELRVGDPRDPETEIGPLLREGDLKQHLAAIELAQKEDGRPLLVRPAWDGSPLAAPLALIRDLTLCSTLQQDEIFGPFVNTATYRFLFEGIGKYANSSVGHQAAYLLDPEPERALTSAERLQFARVYLGLEPEVRATHRWYLAKGCGAGEQGYQGLVRFLSKVSVLGDIRNPLN